MKVTKIGHCCLLVEYKNKRILTDPGAWSTSQNALSDIDIILITHEHVDHLHIDSLKIILQNNQQAKIITNTSVGILLNKEDITYTIIEDGQQEYLYSILIEGFGSCHEEIYKELGQVENTGYFIDNKLFYPGDAFTNPGKPVEILALPIVAPWTTFKKAMEYALEIKPTYIFPVHDGMLISTRPGPIYRLPPIILDNTSSKFIPLLEGDTYEF